MSASQNDRICDRKCIANAMAGRFGHRLNFEAETMIELGSTDVSRSLSTDATRPREHPFKTLRNAVTCSDTRKGHRTCESQKHRDGRTYGRTDGEPPRQGDDQDDMTRDARASKIRHDFRGDPTAMTRRWSAHPVADIFPLMGEREVADLADDIGRNGLREPIWIHRDGRVIDGRNRMAACTAAGVEPETRTWAGDDADLVPFVLSLNLHRRHLSDGQRAMVAERVANLSKGANQHSPSGESTTQRQAAALLNVSKRSVERARVVRTRGVPELVAAVEGGHIPLSTAEALTEHAPTDQREEVKTITAQHAQTNQRRKLSTPLPTQCLSASRQLESAVKRWVKLSNEKQFQRNAGQIANRHRGDLTRALDALTDVLSKFPTENP